MDPTCYALDDVWIESEADLSCRDVLEDYDKKMRDAESESHEGKRKAESVW